MSGRRASCGVAALLAALALGSPAQAVVPSASRVVGAVADANRAARRDRALQLTLELVRDDAVVASGELLADPSGRARLELRSPSGLVERHLRHGAAYEASRNGEPLAAPQPLLPPLALLQQASGPALAGVLSALGGTADAIALGYVGEADCYVLGGRPRGPDRGDPPLRASLWVDLESFQPVRIDGGDGVRYQLGPPAAFGRMQLPAWIAVELPGQPERRFVVRAASAARPDARAFDPSWLRAGAGQAPMAIDPAAAGAGRTH